MKNKKLDRYLDGTVIVLILNGFILFLLNMYTVRLLKHSRFGYETKDVEFWLSKLDHVISFSGWYQYIYILPLIVWQTLKKRLWLSMGIFSGSLITLFLCLIKL